MENKQENTPDVTPTNEEEGTSQSSEAAPEESLPQSENAPLEQAVSPAERKPPPAWLRKSLPWIVVILVSLLTGFGLAYFLLYVPMEQARFEAVEKVSLQAEQIEELEANLSETRQQFQQTQTELEQTSQELKAVQYTATLTALQNNVSYARLALVTKDLLTARQELSSASSNLRKLASMLDNKEIETALTERLALIRTNLVSDPEKSLEELRILAENLSRLEKP